jgi:hypothetical protein
MHSLFVFELAFCSRTMTVPCNREESFSSLTHHPEIF